MKPSLYPTTTSFAACLPCICVLGCFLGSIGTCTAQQSDSRRATAIKQKEYQAFLGQVLATNGSSLAPVPTFLLDVSDNPALKLSFPVLGYSHSQTARNFLFLDGKVASKNGFTPVIAKGEWLPEAEAGPSYTFLANRNIWFYDDDITPATPLDSLPISKASRIAFGWFNFKGTYNYAKYAFYNDAAGIALADRLYKKEYNSFFFRSSFNEYFFSSRNYLFLPTLYGNIGYEFRSNDNNYLQLNEVKITQKTLYTDAAGNVIEVLTDESKARSGTFIRGTSHTIPASLTMLFHRSDNKFYIGFSFYGQRRWINSATDNAYRGSYDIGTSINLPIQKENGKTVANFSLRADIRDVKDELLTGTQNRSTFREKARLGFTLATVILNHRPRE